MFRFGPSRSSHRYQTKTPGDDELRLAMIRLANQYGRYGYRKVPALLRMEGWRVHHKKIERLWGSLGLQLPHRKNKRCRLYHHNSSVIRLRPTHPNHIGAIDFVYNKLSNGRIYKILTVLGEYTCEALCAAVRPKIDAHDVLDVLHTLLMKHGKLKFINSDNDSEFIAGYLQEWLKKLASSQCKSIQAALGGMDITNALTEH